MKVRKGKAISVALYGDVETVQPRKQMVILNAAEDGVHLVTTPDEQPIYLHRHKIPVLIKYLERFYKETEEQPDVDV